MLISGIAAFLAPFEVFLFVYAFIGPLHYLTEISWLHDKNYFTKGRYDYCLLVLIALIVSLLYYSSRFHIWPLDSAANIKIVASWKLVEKLLFLALFGAVVLAFAINLSVKVFLLLIVFSIGDLIFLPGFDTPGHPLSQSNLSYLLLLFLPTLMHVYLFTGFFLAHGALKNKSLTGLLSFIFFLVCPVILIYTNEIGFVMTEYAKSIYGNINNPDGFFHLNKAILEHYFTHAIISKAIPVTNTRAAETIYWNEIVYNRKPGIELMRFIAFAYVYHYGNWFSKTGIIGWHKIPKKRFLAIIIIWMAGIAVYTYNYARGLHWLFFLSLVHILLELPLNMASLGGIFRESIIMVKKRLI